MTHEEAVARLRALRGRLRSQGTQSTKEWKKRLRHGDAEAITYALSIVEVCEFCSKLGPKLDSKGHGAYPNDGRDGAQIIFDAGMNDMGK